MIQAWIGILPFDGSTLFDATCHPTLWRKGMSEPKTTGDSFVTSFQDVAPLLSLLGVEECERHVANALVGGYLFAAAAPLSIFGSLGIVKVAYSTLLATMAGSPYGAKWLKSFNFQASTGPISMVNPVTGTMLYGAEVHLQRLMKEQCIDDPELVKDIEWFGWRRSTGLSVKSRFSWNISLILASVVLSLVSFSPYLYLIHNNWGRATFWLLPILRPLGSLLCVISVPLALQIRIHRIVAASLILMKARKRYPHTFDVATDRDLFLELRLRNLRHQLGCMPDEENPDKEYFAETRRVLDAIDTPSQHALIFLLQAILVAGMVMIIVGYVGCFNLVRQTDLTRDPYIWLGMEIAFVLLRFVLWGWDPSWDEGNTGMIMRLALRSRDLTLHTPPVLWDSEPATSDKGGPLQLAFTSAISHFPLITTSQTLSRLTSHIQYGDYRLKEHKKSFIARNANDFLAAATPFVGLLPRLQEERKDILLYYAIIPDVTHDKKLLCMTARRVDSQWASVSVLIDGDMSYTAFNSRSQDFPGTRALKVTLENEVQLYSVETVDHQTLYFLIEYSFHLFSRLCTVKKSGDQLPLSWNATLPSSFHEAKIEKSIPLAESDKNYIRTRQIHDLKGDYCLQRGSLLPGVFRSSEEVELGLILESAVMEVALCLFDHRFARHISSYPTFYSRLLSLEWILAMEDRISLEKEACRKRWEDSTQARLLSRFEATYDTLVRELRSLRHAPTDSIWSQGWEEAIAIITRSDQSPSVSELFELPLLRSLEHVTNALRPLLTSEGGVPTAVYHNMITSLRSSLLRLRDLRGSSLYDRIDPYGPGSPDFDPPYTKIRQVSEETQKALSLGLDKGSIEMLDIDLWAGGNVLGTLRFLDFLPPSLSLTSVFFRQVTFVDKALDFIVKILERHHKIICLLLDDCGPDNRTRIDEIIAANRLKWMEEARSGDEFTYDVGCDLNPVNQGDYRAAQVYHHDILLTNRADVFAMIYVPGPGKIVLNLSLRLDEDDINLVATLTRSDPTGEVDASNNGHSVRLEVIGSGSPGYESVPVNGFPELQEGCYKLRISLEKGGQYLFRKLEIKFTERSAGGDSDRELGGSELAEGAVIVEEGEISGEEGVSLGTPRLGDTIYSGSRPDTDPVEREDSPQQGGSKAKVTGSENAQEELETSGFEEVIDEAPRSRTEVEDTSSQQDDDGVLMSKKERHSTSMGESAGDSGSNSAESHHPLERSPQPSGTTGGDTQSELVLEGLGRGVEDVGTSPHPQMKGEDGT